jgi:hypothetical protein
MLAVVSCFATSKATEIAPTCVWWWCEPVGYALHNIIATTTAAFVVVCVIVFGNINNDILWCTVLVGVHLLSYLLVKIESHIKVIQFLFLLDTHGYFLKSFPNVRFSELVLNEIAVNIFLAPPPL